MGYQVKFKPTPEKMDGYKQKSDNLFDITPVKKYTLELLVACLKKQDRVEEAYFNIRLYLSLLKSAIIDEERGFAYNRWADDENGELTFNGWEFAHDRDYDGIVDSVSEDLTIIACVVDTEDYLSEKHEFEYNDPGYNDFNSGRFDKKRSIIKEIIDEFIMIMEDAAIHEIINDLDEFKVKKDNDIDIGE